MGSDIIGSIVTVLLAVIGVAIISVLVSGQAQTGKVITAGGNAFSNILGAATAPVSSGPGFTGFAPTSLY